MRCRWGSRPVIFAVKIAEYRPLLESVKLKCLHRVPILCGEKIVKAGQTCFQREFCDALAWQAFDSRNRCTGCHVPDRLEQGQPR